MNDVRCTKKRLLFLVFFLALMPMWNYSVVAEERASWYYTSFDVAKSTAQKENRPLFVYLHKPICSRCVSTWDGISTDQALQKRLNEEVVFVFVDTEAQPEDFRKAYFSIRSEGGSFGTPLIGIVRQDGTVVVDNEGYVSVKQINQFLDKLR